VSTWHASASGEVFALASASGTIYAGGGFSTVDGSARANLAAVKGTDGTVLPWNPGTDGQVRALRFTSATRLNVGGSFTHIAGAAATNLGAVDPTTGAPLPFQTHISYPVIGLASDAAGLYAAGGGGGGNFAAFSPTTGNQLWEGGTNGNVQAISVVAGAVYLGGHFQTYCGPQHGQHTCTTPIARNKLLAVDETNGDLLAWNPGANSVLGVFALQGVGANGDMLVGGDFTSTGQRAQQGYAQYTP
jgi:outer membrane protein assembly factor BamB